MRDRIAFDIVISGGGLAGLIAALALGGQGYHVLCVDPQSRDEINAPYSDTRTTALLMPTIELLREWGIYDAIAAHAAPLKCMRILDISGEAPVGRDFKSSELDLDEFGMNVANAPLRRALLEQVDQSANSQIWAGASVRSMTSRSDEAIVEIIASDGKVSFVSAQLVIAADGRNSPLRDGAGIGTRTHAFGQTALTFAVSHPIPHDGVSTEIHQSGGPFTLVPLPQTEGPPRSSVVWMDDQDAQQRRMALDEAAFEEEIFARSGGEFGPLSLISPRQSWPIITRVAQRLWARRLVLMAEAAHVMPPIGAQGLNTSVADLRTLLTLLDQGLAPGSDALGKRYGQSRHLDVNFRVGGVSMLNHASQSGAPWFQALRRTGIETIHDVGLIRRSLMHLGLGVRSGAQ